MASDDLVGESLIRPPGSGGFKPPNTFSIWRYLFVGFVVFLGALYALPNLYPPDYALQIRPENPELTTTTELLDEAREVLTAGGVNVIGTEVDNGSGLIRLESNPAQLTGQALLRGALNPKLEATGETEYIVALNRAPTTPQWLRDIGGKPISLGLDLSGGVHFLLQVDMETFLEKRGTIAAATISDMLFDNKIRAQVSNRRSPWAKGTTISIPFRSEEQRTKALELLQGPQVRYSQDYTFAEQQVKGYPGVVMTATEDYKRGLEDYAIDQNLQSLRNRVNELGVSEPLVQRLGRSRIVLDLPGIQDSAEAKKIINKFANLEFRLVAGTDVRASETEKFPYEGRDVALLRRNIVSGDQVINAQQDYDPDSGLPQVSIGLDSDGGNKMFDATKDNIGNQMAVLFLESKTRQVKTMVDGVEETKLVTRETKRLINVATIQAALGHNFRITGLDSLGEARELALLLRAGALAAPMYIVEERTVGAQLGDDNIKRGFQSLAVGLGLVALFMMVYYKFFGVAAVFALTANLLLITAIMSLLGATLTLPGIAGIVLTIGMAVDANVLIFSRIREELRDRAPQAAIQAGFDRAFVTILDANITTFFVAIILFTIGSGPVKGFAVTLAIGIVTSMFTAIMGTRALVNLMYGGRKLDSVTI